MQLGLGFVDSARHGHRAGRVTLTAVLSAAAMALAGLGVAAPAARAADALTPVDLGTLGGQTSVAAAVRDSIVTGWAETSSGDIHAFAYDLAAPSPTMRDLGTLGGHQSQAVGSSGNIVVGYSDTAAGVQHAFSYDLGAASPVMRDLGTIGDDLNSRAVAVQGGIVVGISEPADQSGLRTFAYDLSETPGTMRDLGNVGGSYSAPRAINDDVVVGYAYTAGNSEDYAFAYDLADAAPVMWNLGSLGGTESEARAVSGHIVVGVSNMAGDRDRHAFSYDLAAADPVMTDLGTLGGARSSAEAIDGHTLVGTSTVASGENHAFVYDLDAAGPSMRDLGTLGGTFSIADHIRGDIITGLSEIAGGDWHAFAYDLGDPDPSMQELGTLGGSTSVPTDLDVGVIAGYASPPGGAVHAVVWRLPGAADNAGPEVTIGSPAAAATYTVGDTATAAFDCADPSGLASCTATVSGHPVSAGAPLDTTVTGTFTLTVTGVDTLGNTTRRTTSYTVAALPGGAAAAVTGGGTVTTDPGGAGASPTVPVQTTITAPAQINGVLSVTPRATTTPPPTGFSLFGSEVAITGPPASAASPYRVTFTIDASALGGVAPADVQVFRNGVPVSGCTGPIAAAPDPCVASRGFGPDGDAQVSVRTSQFSTWSLGRLRYNLTGPFPPVDPAPTINTAKAGSAIPVKFKLGGDKGLDVFAAGYPQTRATSCGGAATDEVEQLLTDAGSALSYDNTSGQYTYKWKTTTALQGCRDLTLRFRDGSTLRALFTLR